jgi:hypothetical protein
MFEVTVRAAHSQLLVTGLAIRHCVMAQGWWFLLLYHLLHMDDALLNVILQHFIDRSLLIL